MTAPAGVGPARRAWAAVVQAALLGAAHAPPGADGPPGGLGALLAAASPSDATATPERALLDQAAALSLYLRAGRLPAPAPEPAPPPASDDADDLPVCPPAAAVRLAAMLAGDRRDVVPEWLDHARAAGVRVPPALLPAVLDLARTTPPVRAALAAPLSSLGARGRWLAAQNPAWSFAAPLDADAARRVWAAGTPAEREAALAGLRHADPADARALLAAAWPHEGAAARARLLGTLAVGLGPDDESLLEHALDDRSRDVRAAAAALLAALPSSALVERSVQRARDLLRVEPAGAGRPARLHVAPPGPPDSAAERDGVERVPRSGLGERAWWLTQLVAAVPPAAWVATLGTGPAELVALAAGSEWEAPLAEGWAHAASRHRDAEWADALLRSGLLAGRNAVRAFRRADLFAVLPPAARERLLADVFADRLLFDDVEGLLDAIPAPWGDALARTALEWLKRRIARGELRAAEALPAFALAASPELADEAAEGWLFALAPFAARAVEQCVQVLAFRRGLDAAFLPPEP